MIHEKYQDEATKSMLAISFAVIMYTKSTLIFADVRILSSVQQPQLLLYLALAVLWKTRLPSRHEVKVKLHLSLRHELHFSRVGGSSYLGNSEAPPAHPWSYVA